MGGLDRAIMPLEKCVETRCLWRSRMDNYRPEQPMNRYKHATVIGCGTTGLPCAVALAMVGVTVTGVDTDVEYVTQLSKGHIERLDDGLLQGLAKAISGAMITFSSAIVAT